MKKINYIVICLVLTFGCGNETKQENSTKVKLQKQAAELNNQESTNVKASEIVDLSNKGIGPITTITLSPEIDQEMVTQGESVFNKMCTACHIVGQKSIGPSPNGILERRTPEWIMNMILNPEEMVAKDPLAKQLLLEYNGAPMVNQNLSEKEARAILEYYRTLE